VKFGSVIRDLAAEAKVLDEKVRLISKPPSPAQLQAVQEAINEMQRKLNRLQTEVDAWSEQREV
jgi:hypothetical protein